MKKFLLITIFFISQLYALQFCYEEADWCYDVSTFQAFYFFNIDNATLEYAGGSGVIENGDAIGAFKTDENGNDVCVGFLRIGNQNQPDGNGIIALPTMGDDGSFPNYLNAEEVEYIHIPVDFNNPSSKDFEKFVSNIERHQGKKIWVHCAANMRVSAFVYKYRRDVLKLPHNEIVSDMKAIWTPNKTWRVFLEERGPAENFS